MTKIEIISSCSHQGAKTGLKMVLCTRISKNEQRLIYYNFYVQAK